MVDNVVLNSGAGGVTAATDDVAGIHYQRVKLVDGTLDATEAIPGTAANGLDVDVTRVIPGTTALAAGKAEDDAHASGDVGVFALAVRRDVPAVGSLTDGDYSSLNVNASGRLYTSTTVDAALPAGTNNIGDVDVLTLPALPAGTNNIGDVDVLTLPALPAGTNNIGDVDVLTLPAGSMAAVAARTSDYDTGAGVDTVPMVGLALPAAGGAVQGGTSTNPVRTDPVGTTTQPVSGTVTANLAAGINNIGDVDVLTLPALPAGTNNIGDVDIVTMPNVTLAAGTNTNEVVGDVAHDSPVGGNPLLQGFEARSSDGTAVASGDVVRALATLLGKQVSYLYALPGTDWHSAAAAGGIVNTTGVTAKAAAGVGIRNYVTRAEIINGHATVSTDFQIRDGAAGTVLWRGFLQAAGGGVAATFDPPLRGTANTLVEIACGTTGSAVYANLHGFAAAE